MHAKFIYSCIQTCNAHPIPSMGTDSIYHIEREQNIANANNIGLALLYFSDEIHDKIVHLNQLRG